MRSVSLRSKTAVLIAGLALAVTACGDDNGGGGATATATGGGGGGGGESVKVAFMGALTGPNAQLGINIRNGAELAIDQYNATNPEVTIELVDKDTTGDPNQAAALAPTIIDEDIVAVIGPAFSGESKTAVPILEEAGIPNVSPSATNAELGTNGWTYWRRVLANDSVQGPGIADFISNQMAAQSVAIIDDQSEYGVGLAEAVRDRLQENGTGIALENQIDPAESSYSATVNAIRGSDADVVYFAGYYNEAGNFVQQLRDAGVDATFVSSDGTLDAQFIESGGEAAEGAIISCTCVLATASDDENVQAFIDAYNEAYGENPATYSAEGYDAATAIIEAVKAGNTDGESINEFLGGYSAEGISKPIDWGEDGELVGGSVYIHRVTDGEIEALGNYEEAEL